MTDTNYADWADRGRAFTRRVLTWGAGNRVESGDAFYIPTVERFLTVGFGRSFMLTRTDTMSVVEERLEIARVAMALTTGNCSEFAAVNFCFCLANGVFPIEVWGYYNDIATNHQILVLGRQPSIAPTHGHAGTHTETATYMVNPWRSIPEDRSWVSDGWANDAYPAAELTSREISLSKGKVVTFQLQAGYYERDAVLEAKAAQLIRSNGF